MRPTTLDALRDAVATAASERAPLRVRGGGSKDFYGGMLAGQVLDTGGYCGVVAYEPTELYVTARCGTRLAEVESVLAERGQMLAFEPPAQFGCGLPENPGESVATVGGAVAAGLAGPRRQQVGGVRDFILGVKLVDGSGRVLEFGGQVMKNVAGYDVSRLMAGSMGTLGLIAEVTLKVLPRPQRELSLAFEMGEAAALGALGRWAGQPLPLSASFWHEGRLVLRLSGAEPAVLAARARLGGEALADGGFWPSVREQRHPAYAGEILWRLALPKTTPPLGLAKSGPFEWGGGQRWLSGEIDPGAVRAAAAEAGGHAVLFRAPESLRCRVGAFAVPAPAVLELHRRVKRVFDPSGIFNPGRLYAEL